MEVQLRPWKYADAEDLARLANNRKIWDNARDQFPHPYTLKKADEWLSAVLAQKPVCNYAITVDGKLAGGVGIVPQEDVARCSAEIGYWVGEPFWGQNVATLAVMRILPIAWKELPGLTRIYGQVFDFNKASMRVLEKCGFHLESIRKRSVIKNGVVGDDFIYVILRD
jgi:RimJ/RimL family protein N-acetyltransferase